MKNTIFSLAAIALLVTAVINGCQSHDQHPEQTTDTSSVTTHTHDEGGSDLQLNNGVKWKADSITNANVGAISKIISEAKPVSLEDYHATGSKIQEAIQQLINGCTMQGADHEALHHWLEPLLDINAQLVGSTTTEKAADVFKTEGDHVQLYFQYFE